MSGLPDFVVIGAMKCATTTLHEQLARQPGIWMSRPKEPNFFSDDENYKKGFDWYCSLFQGAAATDLRGESSTHYTKLPSYPRTVARMWRAMPAVKLVYLMRHPIDRLISNYVHEVTTGRIRQAIHQAIDRYPELVDYGRYSMQLEPFLAAFGPQNVLPVAFTRLIRHPQDELERICAFLGYKGEPEWDGSLGPQNVGSQRLRRSALREILVRAPLLTRIRKCVVPKPWNETIKALWRVRPEGSRPSPESLDYLRDVFDEDLKRLGSWLGIALDCDHFDELCASHALQWVNAELTV